VADDDEQLELSDDAGERADSLLQRQFRGTSRFSGTWIGAIADEKSAQADDSDDGWTPLGPRNVGGAVRALAQDPTQGATWYAGTAQAGLWRTQDDGNTWQPAADDGIGVVPVGAVAIASTDRRFIYVGTGEPQRFSISGVGLFRSKDAGETFERIAVPGDADGADRYTRLAVDPLDAERFWAASDNGLFRYEGKSATKEPVPLAAGNQAVSDVVTFPDPAAPTQSLIVMAALHGQGIVRGRFDRNKKKTDWSTAAGNVAPSNMCAILLANGSPLAGTIGRIRLAAAPSNTSFVYAVMEETNPPAGRASGFPTIVFQSQDAGVTFRAPAGATQAEAPPAAAGGNSGAAGYTLVLAVHPTQPNTLLLGSVRLSRSRDAGVSWTPITDPQQELTFTRRGEHADLHSIVFDSRQHGDSIWTANDGGVSFSDDAGASWRKRSYGIQAAQCVDVTTHPVFPSMVACGMQDNGVFISYGGPTWYRIGHSDGGAVVFDPNDTRRIFVTNQMALSRTDVSDGTGTRYPPTTLVDVPPTLPAPASADNVMVPMENILDRGGAIPAANAPVFQGLIVADPTQSNRFLVGRKLAAFITTDGTTFTPLNTGAFTAPPPPAGGAAAAVAETSALAFGPGAARSTDFYVGTSTGDIFFTKNAGVSFTQRNPFTPDAAGAQAFVSGLATCAVDSRIVAAAAYFANNKLILSHDGGSTWVDITGDSLPRGPVTCLLFHPSDERVLFVGTLVGVWVARDLPKFVAGGPQPPSANVKWKKFNAGLGPLLVQDLELVPETLTLRCATYARGCFEANLRGVNANGSTPGPHLTPEEFRVPPVRLNIRDHGLDDSRAHASGHSLGEDPRLRSTFPMGHLDCGRSADIRIDAPLFRDKRRELQSERFGNLPDGAELDESFISESPLLGDSNVVYVQVHNRGWQPVSGARVWLFFADASPAGIPPKIPDQFDPGAEPASPWERAAPVQTVNIAPGQPSVVKFLWTPPLRIRSHVALLAVCSHAADPVQLLPEFEAKTYARFTRQAALFVSTVERDRVFIRDGLDDFGTRGSVAWGGRSPDIIVLDKATADGLSNPTDVNGPLSDLGDPRRGDRAHNGDNVVFVRVHNRSATQVDAEIQLYQAPLHELTGSAWTRIGGPANAQVTVPPNGWALSNGIAWQLSGPDPKDPLAQAYTLVALVRAVDTASNTELDPFPDLSSVQGVDDFWRFFSRGPLANNAAFRALRFV